MKASVSHGNAPQRALPMCWCRACGLVLEVTPPFLYMTFSCGEFESRLRVCQRFLWVEGPLKTRQMTLVDAIEPLASVVVRL